MGIIIPNRAIRNSVFVNGLYAGVTGSLTGMVIHIFCINVVAFGCVLFTVRVKALCYQVLRSLRRRESRIVNGYTIRQNI